MNGDFLTLSLALFVRTGIWPRPYLADMSDQPQDLARIARNINWQIGDHVNQTERNSPDSLDAVISQYGRPQSIRTIAATARRFPPASRDYDLSYTHHEAVAPLPDDEALKMLWRAKSSGWDARQTKRAVIARMLETGQLVKFDDDDLHDRQLYSLAKVWNRSQIPVRQDFIEMIEESELGDIDP